MPFQKTGVEFLKRTSKPGTILGDEMGLGKTAQAICAVRDLKSYPCLVCCPSALTYNWLAELDLWDPGATWTMLAGRTPDKAMLDPLTHYTIIGYEIMMPFALYDSADLDSVHPPPMWVNLLMKKFRTMICDEAHKLKNDNSLRSKAVRLVKKTAERIILLSGTPVENRPSELWPLIKLAKRSDEVGGFWYFFKRYCGADHSTGFWDMSGCTNAQELNLKLRGSCYLRRVKQEVLPELPEKFRQIQHIEITNRDEYDALEERGPMEPGPLAFITELRMKANEGKLAAGYGWVDQFLSETDRKLVIFAYQRETQRKYFEILSTGRSNVLWLSGDDTPKEKQAAVDRFNTDRTARVIVASMMAGGTGFNLTAAADILFVEQGWTPALHLQCEDRCHRIGQSQQVNVTYLVAGKTIDERVYHLVNAKREVVDAVTDGKFWISESITEEMVKQYGRV